MKDYLKKGYLGIEDIISPADERFAKGQVAVIECVQNIPCNPCQDACPRGAITIEGAITNIPKIMEIMGLTFLSRFDIKT